MGNVAYLGALQRDQVPVGTGEVWQRADCGIHSGDRSVEIKLSLLRRCGIRL